MKKIFLLRAYGDFVIAIGSICNSENRNNIEIIASSHFETLYNSILKTKKLEFIKIKFVDFGIQKSLFNFFTNKNFLNFNTIIQLKKLKLFSSESKNYDYYLEHKSRLKLLNLLLFSNFKYILKGKNIYNEWYKFLNYSPYIHSSTKLKNFDTILILPDARLKKRKIPFHIISKIKFFTEEYNLNLKIGTFSKSDINSNIYSNFDELILMIESADLIITADSLPAHLCNFLNKQHFILYPPKGKTNFFTPFVLKNKFYCTFDDNLDKYFKKWI